MQKEPNSSVCAQMCTAWDTSRGNKISTCGHTTTNKVVGAAEVWWDGSRNRSAAVDRHTLQEGQAGKTRRGCAVSVKEQLRCVELFYRMGGSLWLSISGDASK